jgi:hypothetical protein
MACAPDADDAAPAAEPAGAPAADLTTMPQELADRTEQYTAAWNSNDPAAVAAFFTDNATARVGDDAFTGGQGDPERLAAKRGAGHTGWFTGGTEAAPERYFDGIVPWQVLHGQPVRR